MLNSIAGALALTPDLSRLARQELGMSQAIVSKASGVQAYVIKQWETGRFRPPAAALEKLAAFYEAEGVDLEAIREHLSPGSIANPVARGSEPRELGAGFTHSARPGFFIAEGLPTDLVGRLMERMETNDDRIAELTAKSFENSFFGGPTGATETYLRELMGTLAESYLLFRLMQGRNIVAKTARQGRDEPNTIGEYLSHWVHDESAAAALFDADPSTPEPGPGEGTKAPALSLAVAG